MVETELEFQNSLSHNFYLTVSEGKDLFISAGRRHCLVLNFFFNFMFTKEYGML